MKTVCLTVLALTFAMAARAQELPSGPVSLANGRVVIGADLSVSLTPQDDTDGAWFNYTDYEHNALRLFRAGLTADVRLTDRVSILTEIRSENGDSIKPYALYVRVRPWRDRPDRYSGRTHPADLRRIRAARIRRGQSADRLSARLPISDGGPPGCAAGIDRGCAAHAGARMAAELSHRIARDCAGHAAHHGVSVGHRRAGARRARVVECQRGRHQRQPRPIRARATTTAASRSPDGSTGGRPPPWRSAARRREVRMSPTRRWRPRRCLPERHARRSRPSASTRNSRAITGCCAAS